MLKITFDQGEMHWEWKNRISWFSKKKNKQHTMYERDCEHVTGSR